MFANRLGGHTADQGQGCEGVAQAVKIQRGHFQTFDQVRKLLSKSVRQYGRAIGLGEHVACLLPQRPRFNLGQVLASAHHVQQVDYIGSQEVSAMGKLSQEELEMVYKIGFKPPDYLANK